MSSVKSASILRGIKSPVTSAFNVLRNFQIVSLLWFDWNKVNFHCDNVSKITLSRQAYNMFQTSLFRTFEIENHVDILWYD